jgi:hypothetical protein
MTNLSEDPIRLFPITTASKFVYQPEGVDYVYRIEWDKGIGYKVQRRRTHLKTRAFDQTFWNDPDAVECWVKFKIGRFEPVSKDRPVIILENIGKALNIIRDDVRAMLIAASRKTKTVVYVNASN